jgi:glycosyltransferase involved in cell wall biosynthesis
MTTNPPTDSAVPVLAAAHPWIGELQRERPPLVVFSHLRWGGVFQRPQHLMSRLAADFDVYFVEEPVHDVAGPHLEASCPAPGVEVLVPHLRFASRGSADSHVVATRALLSEFLADRGVVEPLVWLCSPMALPLVDDLDPTAVIYDAMDEYAASRAAPARVRARDTALMELADIVLAGGPSLHEVRRARHPNVHCLPSGVDAEHFAPTRLAALAQSGSLEAAHARALHATLPRPRLGFSGVIDERLDLVLLDALAERRPDWQIVMVGPVARIDPSTLPCRPNLHWLGRQAHDELPHLQAQWDVCLLPFALDEATRHANPPEVLEYLAGDRPVVATTVNDVAELYGPAVHLGDGVDGFVAACAQALSERGDAREARRAAARDAVRASTWADTAAQVRALLEPFLPPLPEGGAFAAPTRERPVDVPPSLEAAIAALGAIPAEGARPAAS